MTDRATAWSLTINNPTQADEESIQLARQKGWQVIGQLEEGENGTKHYQLLLKTPRIRFGGVKKLFPRAHIEVARNVAALEQYVQKDDTRVAHLQQDQEKYPSLQRLWSLFADWIDEKGLAMAAETWTPEKWLTRFDHFIEDLIYAGYVVETMAVNPQIRACIKSYGRAIVIRSRGQRDGQDDGQTTVYTESSLEEETNANEENPHTSSPREETHEKVS